MLANNKHCVPVFEYRCSCHLLRFAVLKSIFRKYDIYVSDICPEDNNLHLSYYCNKYHRTSHAAKMWKYIWQGHCDSSFSVVLHFLSEQRASYGVNKFDVQKRKRGRIPQQILLGVLLEWLDSQLHFLNYSCSYLQINLQQWSQI